MTIKYLTVVICLFLTTESDINSLWSAEHLDDYIMSDAYRNSIPALTPAIIALFETQCQSRLYHEIGFTDRGLPPATLLTIAQFDRTKASDAWYQFEDEMDLFKRYNISTHESNPNEWCPTILYQPAIWSKSVIKYNANDNLSYHEWAIKMMEMNISFTNNLNESIYITKQVQNVNDINDLVNEAIFLTINPTETVSELFYISDKIIIYNERHKMLQRIIINGIDEKYILNDNQEITDMNILDTVKYEAAINEEIAFKRQRNWMTRRRYLFNTKIPPIIPHYTELGFEHHKMPQEVCDYLTKFHEENRDKVRKENFPADNPLINHDEIPMHMLHIPGDKKKWIASIIEPLLEEWTGSKLQFSILYGLREYSQGAVLKGHCDKLSTHVISAILHLNHYPLNVSWPIEVYGFDKKRHYLEDAPCTMTYYESSTLIHGRPSTYSGNLWVNAFIHFRPIEWKYESTRDNFVITPQAKIPLVDPALYG